MPGGALRLSVERGAVLPIQGSSALHRLLQAHAHLLKTALDRDPFVLAKFLARCFALPAWEALPYGRSVFDRHPHPDAYIWNTVARAYLRAREPLETLRLFRRMRLSGSAAVDSFGLSLAVQACAWCRDVRIGGGLHGGVIKYGFESDGYVQTAIVEMYGKVGDLVRARRVFDEMPRKDLVAHNVMLAEYVSRGDIIGARCLFDGMPHKDLVSWNTMIHGFATSGDLVSAREIFESTHGKDVVSWSSMISAYARSRQSKEALCLFREMQLAGVMPDKITMVSLLSACGELGALGTGKMIHKYIERHGLEVDVKLGTSLLDMYAKCGDIENSMKIFSSMKIKDVFTWSAMITGLANHGRSESALCLFSKMLSEELRPNGSTFIGVLTACSHAGLVSKGRAFFYSMSDVHGVSPSIEHYGCLVDLLGRAGHLEEARKVIRGMPFTPDAVVWRALLGACRIHKNVELAEEAAHKLMQLEPRVEGHYVLFSNVLSQARRWEGVANVRKMMRDKGIQKPPGSSSMELGGAVHEFVAGDRSHPKAEQIYETLAEMHGRLREAGHRPMTSLVVQDMDHGAKELALAQHSEKLALAFGLLSTPAGSTIRIVKNLRFCEDCHSVFKLASSIYGRKLVVRDRNRFHHFDSGLCSCADYW